MRLILSDLDANRFAAASASPQAGSGKEAVVSGGGFDYLSLASICLLL